MLVLDGKREGALGLTSHRVRPISRSGPVPNIKRIFPYVSRSVPTLLKPNMRTTRMEWLHSPRSSTKQTLKGDVVLRHGGWLTRDGLSCGGALCIDFLAEKESGNSGHPYPMLNVAYGGFMKASGSSGSWLPLRVGVRQLQGFSSDQKVLGRGGSFSSSSEGPLIFMVSVEL
jgi:hypothetical protein